MSRSAGISLSLTLVTADQPERNGLRERPCYPDFELELTPAETRERSRGKAVALALGAPLGGGTCVPGARPAEHKAAELGLLGGLPAIEVETEPESPSRHLSPSSAD